MFPKESWSPWGSKLGIRDVRMVVKADEIRDISLEVNRARRFDDYTRPNVFWTSSWRLE